MEDDLPTRDVERVALGPDRCGLRGVDATREEKLLVVQLDLERGLNRPAGDLDDAALEGGERGACRSGSSGAIRGLGNSEVQEFGGAPRLWLGDGGAAEALKER
jgi:hypothetical protein